MQITEHGDRWIGETTDEIGVWSYSIFKTPTGYRYHSEPMDDAGEHFDYEGTDIEEGMRQAMARPTSPISCPARTAG